jgi:peptidoglycan/LPS O-acetylase OafA/YrhL
MNRVLSVYLDLWRVVAALIVFVFHFSSGDMFQKSYLSRSLGLESGRVAHLAVVIFFVLSGYLIARSADKPKLSWQRYFSDRLARMYSVLIPAVLLDAAVMLAIRHLNPGVWSALSGGDPLLPFKYLTTLGFLHQIWSLNAVSYLLGPAWSVGYEFWYYVGLGLWTFLPGRRMKWLGCGLLLLFTGPKIALLSGAWLAGVAAWHLSKTPTRLTRPALQGLFVLSLGATLLPMIFSQDLPWVPRSSSKWIGLSANAQTDTVYSLAVALNVWSLSAWAPSASWLEHPAGKAGKTAVGYLAGISFSLYLFHRPLIALMGTLFGTMQNIPQQLAAMAGVLAVVALLAGFTERKLTFWKRGTDWLFFQAVPGLQRILSPRRSGKATRPLPMETPAAAVKS